MAAAEDNDWNVAIGLDFLRSDLTPRARSVAIALAYRARSRPYCWASTADLASLTGLHEDSARHGLRELVREGWALRVMERSRRVRRLGVVLLDRPDRRFHPAARTPDEIAAAREALRCDRAAWEATRPKRPGFRRLGVPAGPAN